jgi:hypothetical protein
MTDQERVKSAQALRQLRDDMPLLLEHVALQAQITKAKFDQLVKNGFTPEQALVLCK